MYNVRMYVHVHVHTSLMYMQTYGRQAASQSHPLTFFFWSTKVRALDVVFEGRQHPRSCLILAWPECRADLSPRSTNTTPRCNTIIDPCFEPNIYTLYTTYILYCRVLIVFGIVFFTLLQDTTASSHLECHMPDCAHWGQTSGEWKCEVLAKIKLVETIL